MADKTLDVLYLKYLKAAISYDKETRIERYPYPRSAVREILYNALIHSKWSDGVPVQIRVDEDSMSISNCCVLPIGWNACTLTEKHKSRPYNPNIAVAFFRAGLVETWGRGISKVQQICRTQGYPEPRFEVLGEDLTVVFPAPVLAKPEHSELNGLRLEDAVLLICRENWLSSGEIARQLDVNKRSLRRLLTRMVQAGRLQVLHPEHTKHPHQAYKGLLSTDFHP